MREGWNVIIRHDEELAGTSIWLIEKRADGSEVVVQPVDLTMTHNLEPYEALPPEPTLKFNRNTGNQFLQGLAEALVDAGFRPKVLDTTSKELEAIKYHLEDMRTLVMQALLPPELPPRYLKE